MLIQVQYFFKMVVQKKSFRIQLLSYLLKFIPLRIKRCKVIALPPMLFGPMRPTAKLNKYGFKIFKNLFKGQPCVVVSRNGNTITTIMRTEVIVIRSNGANQHAPGHVFPVLFFNSLSYGLKAIETIFCWKCKFNFFKFQITMARQYLSYPS